ncbi:MAG: DUF503 domain-containing protein [Firmicutes bacterium]|nr:DUF503 domain-containing protein [Bacillota bacterium]
MVVGSLRIELTLPGNDSLKGKRRVVRSLVDRIRSKFGVAAAEVDCLDSWQVACLGFACVSNDAVLASDVLSRILRWVEDNHDGSVTNHEIRLG